MSVVTVQAARISEVDARIQREELVEPEVLSQYLQDIRTAQKDKIQSADIILCTCATSAVSRIRTNTNVMQVKYSCRIFHGTTH